MTDTMPAPRMSNPTELLPDAAPAIHALVGTAMGAGVPRETMELVHLRVSQINGCSFCVDFGWRGARKAGTDEAKLVAVAAWRDSPHFTAAERAALALAEAVTRLSDRTDPVPDDVWDAAARHHDEKQLAALLLWIATTNVFNRINVAVRQPAGQSDPRF
jgi:AhpD family alkylhydroperoxidase